MTERVETTARHTWIEWLSARDAQMLVLILCQYIDDPHVSREHLCNLVESWRRNALRAITADDWTASVDGYIEVKVDARLYVFAHGLERLNDPVESPEDYSPNSPSQTRCTS